MVPAYFRVTLKRFLFLLAAYSFFRLFFLIWNWPMFSDAPTSEIVSSFFLGLRFDTCAVLMTNGILFLYWMLPSRKLARGPLLWLDLAVFGVIQLIIIGGSIGDVDFVNFIGKRASYELLHISGDVEGQSWGIIVYYWKFAIIWLSMTAFYIWKLPRFSPDAPRESAVSGFAWRFLAAALIFLGIRGGIQLKPIGPMNAYHGSRHELGLLTLNTPFNFIKTRPSANENRPHYFADENEPARIMRKLTEPTRPPLGVARKWNVVIIIVESLGLEYTGANDWPGYSPFIDELAKKSFYFKQNFANARRSIDAIPAVICGLPAFMQEPILTSDYVNDRMDCLPKILGEHGYSTYFLHGAHNGSMHFDTFSNIAGFKNFVGFNEYPQKSPEEVDVAWGVLDEPMLQYAVETIDKAAKPTFVSLFTLSSHHPYFIPEKYRGKFPKGTLEIHESIGYVDYSIRKFFEAAETKPWFNNTIFVITGDHTQKYDPNHPEYRSFAGNFRVPLLIYAPALKAEQVGYDPARVTQHIDVLPSLLDLVGISREERLLVGASVFDRGIEGRAYNATSYTYWWVDSKVAVNITQDTLTPEAFAHSTTFDRVEKPASEPVFQEAIQNLKAAVQYMTDGLARNRLYTWKDPKREN